MRRQRMVLHTVLANKRQWNNDPADAPVQSRGLHLNDEWHVLVTSWISIDGELRHPDYRVENSSDRNPWRSWNAFNAVIT